MSFLMATNFEAAYNMCQLAHPLLKASGSASIVFVSSVAGVLGINVGTIYSAAKGNHKQICESHFLRFNSSTKYS